MATEQRRIVVTYVQANAAVNERRARRWPDVHRTPVRYIATPRRDDGPLLERLIQVACELCEGGYQLTWTRRREGWGDSPRQIERVYRHAGSALRNCCRRKLTRPRAPHGAVTLPNTRWLTAFMGDTLATGRVLRLVNVGGDGTCEPLAMEVVTSIPGSAVGTVLTRLVAVRG